MAYRAKDVANYAVHHALQLGRKITNLQLQKILYYLEANHLANHGEALIIDDIQKWKLGPVIPEVYHTYKTFGAGDIMYVPPELVESNEGFLSYKTVNFDPNVILPKDASIIEPIVENLLNHTGFYLVNKTHEHILWYQDQTRINSGEKGITYNKVDMQKFFKDNPSELELING